MKILVLGGTGSIGGAIVNTLIERKHRTMALARSVTSADKLRSKGAEPISGDIRDPQQWIDVVAEVDAVVLAAATWDEHMAEVDQYLLESLIVECQRHRSNKKLIYTGGCWLFGNTAEQVATEESPFNAPDKFDFVVKGCARVLSAPGIKGMVVHPAMVYEEGGGAFSHIYEDAASLGRVRVIGGEHVRWPLVHRDDLALLYALMLENGEHGDVYCGASNEGYPIGKITREIAAKLAISEEPEILSIAEAIKEYGTWAEGYAIDQQMSGGKAMIELNWQPKYKVGSDQTLQHAHSLAVDIAKSLI